MTYASLLSAIYANFDRLWPAWTAEMERAGEIGVYAYFPASYGEVASFEEVKCSYWTVERVRAFLKEGGQQVEGFEELVEDLAVAEEFLVMILATPDSMGRRPVHVHRIGRLSLS